MSDPRYKTEFSLSRLIRYCGKRQRFFDGLHRLSLFINTIAGSSAFVTIIANMPHVAAWLTAIVAVVSALDNVVGFSERARLYAQQRSRYYELYCDLVKSKPSGFVEDVYKERKLRIDRDNPPILRVLDVVSRNEEDISRGHPYGETIFISKFRYFMRHFMDIPPKKWITMDDKLSKS
ncbi:hypothetical protein [Sphingomonas sp. VDB2]|uniref:hypothetical protein n=1 Tax=Sphingomonas sp. VDB2 TaxID=3228751 RepID=UPI003A80C3B0